MRTIIGPVVCSLCRHRWISQRPEKTIQNLECPNCGHMTGEEEEESEIA